MWLPLSVTQPPRHTGRPPRRVSSRATSSRAMGITSTGSGNLPSVATSLVSSTMHTKRAGGGGDDLLARQGAAAALDQLARRVRLVGAIDIEVAGR